MKKKFSLLLLLYLVHNVSVAQSIDTANYIADVFLTHELSEQMGLTKHRLLDEISISRSQTILVATDKAFICIGYGNAVLMNAGNDHISSFCTVGDSIYFVDSTRMFLVDSIGNIKPITNLPFKPIHIWSGENDIYTAGHEDSIYNVYAVSKNRGRLTKFYSTNEPIIGIDELGYLIYVLTERHLTVVNIPGRHYVELQLDSMLFEKPCSLSIDRDRGAIYIASSKGVFRAYESQMDLVCRQSGIIYYDKDGLLIYDSQVPSIVRIRNNVLWESEKPKPVVVRVK